MISHQRANHRVHFRKMRELHYFCMNVGIQALPRLWPLWCVATSVQIIYWLPSSLQIFLYSGHIVGQELQWCFKPCWTSGSQGLPGDSGKRAECVMWCQWACQSNLFSSAFGQRPEHWVYAHSMPHTVGLKCCCCCASGYSTCAPSLFLPPPLFILLYYVLLFLSTIFFLTPFWILALPSFPELH